MGFSVDVERRLLANSGARCANPDCRASLFPDEGDKVITVGEMAHIIGQSERGPRGGSPMSKSERDEYDNVVLLCPSCHRRVDKPKVVDKYSEAVLRQWKADREREVEQASGVPAFDTRDDAVREMKRLLRENRAIFTSVGPGGPQFEDPFSPAASQWRHQLRERIVPNNWRVVALAKRNERHLTDEELDAIAELSVHADALAYNALAAHPREGAPLFPDSMKRLFG